MKAVWTECGHAGWRTHLLYLRVSYGTELSVGHGLAADFPTQGRNPRTWYEDLAFRVVVFIKEGSWTHFI